MRHASAGGGKGEYVVHARAWKGDPINASFSTNQCCTSKLNLGVGGGHLDPTVTANSDSGIDSLSDTVGLLPSSVNSCRMPALSGPSGTRLQRRKTPSGVGVHTAWLTPLTLNPQPSNMTLICSANLIASPSPRGASIVTGTRGAKQASSGFG